MCNFYYKLDQQNAHTLMIFLQDSYMFRASLVHHQGVKLYKTMAKDIQGCW